MGIKDGDGSIYDLYSPSAELILALEDAGIRNMLDVPNDFDLGKKREWQLKAAKEDKLCIDEQKIKKFLSEIKYPIYFLDYETMMSVVPYFEGHKPYQQVPFQYSLHILEKPGSELKHVEYLHKENSCPVKQLSESLKENIETEGSVIVWNQAFEMGCNEDMAVMHPEFKEFYKNVNSRVVDLMVPFFNFWYVDKRFGGSASIKSVLPVLCPDLSYKDLDIPEGAAAQRLWMEAVLDGKRDGEKEKILKDLWDYCGLDTLAMVRIWEFLENLFEKEPVKPLQQTLL
jgi:hypothetical protein